MITFIKNLFKKDPDPSLTAMRKHFSGTYKGLTDVEQAVLLLRISGHTQQDTAAMLQLSTQKLSSTEQGIIRKLQK